MITNNIMQVSTKRGFVLNLIEGDSITQAIQKRGEYDGNTLDSIADILAVIKPNISLDIGANIGNHGLLIASLSKQLVAFEPVGFVYELLKKNLQDNNKTNAVAVNKGLSIEATTKQIFVPTLNLGCASIAEEVGEGESIEIQTVLGDAFLDEHYPQQAVDFIKIDVEGHETEALIGLAKTIQKYQPLVLIEWKNVHTIKSAKEYDLLEKVFSNYHFYSLTHSDNKKLYPRNLANFIKRLHVKLFKKHWCLSSFDSTKSYCNVYMVPARYAAMFSKFPYQATTAR